MPGHYNNASVFGSVGDGVVSGYYSPRKRSNGRTVLSLSPPPPAPPSASYPFGQLSSGDVTNPEERSPLPRQPPIVAVATTAQRSPDLHGGSPSSQSKVRGGGGAAKRDDVALTETSASSTTWCSPVVVRPIRIVPTTQQPGAESPSTSSRVGEHHTNSPIHPVGLYFASSSPLEHTSAVAEVQSVKSPRSQLATTLSSVTRATETYSASVGALDSGERRSVTVMQHSLDNATNDNITDDICIGSGSVDATKNSTGASNSGSGVQARKQKIRALSSDLDSPGRAAEEMREWRSNEQLRAGLTVVPVLETMSSLSTSPAAAAAAATLSTNAVGSASVFIFCNRDLHDASGRRADFAQRTHADSSTSILRADTDVNAGEAPSKSLYGVVSVSTAGKIAQPTPYPVTSTSSLSDWSAAPRLGFPAPVSPQAARAEAESSARRDAEERKREDKWYRLCRGVSLLASATPETIVRLRSAARKLGIPHHLRAVMWLTLTGMALKVDENEYFCANLLRRNGYVTGPNADAITADVQRTFPGHPYFSEQDVGIYKLTNVLHALCWRNPLLSYCQSFNFLAAFLLLVLDDEERVFWLLVYIFEQLLPNDFYGETLLGANAEQVVLERLVQQKLPRVAAKFSAAGLQVQTLVANWMMSMFVNIFPPATSLLLWDYLLCRTTNPGERTPAHLEITLAVLKYMDDKNVLVGEDAGELLIALREQTACLYDAAAVIRIANTFAISPDELHQLRCEAKPSVVQTMKAREQARASEQERRLAQELQFARNANSLASRKTNK